MTDPSDSGWRARVEDDFLGGNVRLLIARRADEGAWLYVTQFGANDFGAMETERVENGAAPVNAGRLRLPEDAARARYDALALHFAGEAGTRQARADLLHERGRVDKLIQVVSQVATARPATSP